MEEAIVGLLGTLTLLITAVAGRMAMVWRQEKKENPSNNQLLHDMLNEMHRSHEGETVAKSLSDIRDILVRMELIQGNIWDKVK